MATAGTLLDYAVPATIQDVERIVGASESRIRGEIASINKRLDALESQVESLEAKVDSLIENTSTIVEILSKLVAERHAH